MMYAISVICYYVIIEKQNYKCILLVITVVSVCSAVSSCFDSFIFNNES